MRVDWLQFRFLRGPNYDSAGVAAGRARLD